MKIIISASASGIVNGKTVEEYGNLQVVYRNSIMDGTFSVLFINRMNNQSIAVHKFNKSKYTVEFGGPQGVAHTLSFKTVDIAAQLALLNTDITRIDEEDAVKARRGFVNAMARYESRAKYIEFPAGAWKLNRFRNKPIAYDGPTGEKETGILNLVLPPRGEKCIVTPDSDKSIRLKLPTDRLWIQ
jgi:hypothetical protein